VKLGLFIANGADARLVESVDEDERADVKTVICCSAQC
jgi:hypothetical protein